MHSPEKAFRLPRPGRFVGFRYPQAVRPAFEIAQAVARFGRRLQANSLTTYQKRTLQAIVACRTAALSGHIGACGECGHLCISYNPDSYRGRNRHCPKCQGLNKEMWAINIVSNGSFFFVFKNLV